MNAHAYDVNANSLDENDSKKNKSWHLGRKIFCTHQIQSFKFTNDILL